MNTTTGTRKIPSHRYSLWQTIVQTGNDSYMVSAEILTMGEHGDVIATISSYLINFTAVGGDGKETVIETPAAHNRTELARATEEGMKWDERLRQSPLGTTQQDFVAYYDEVIGRFRSWLTNHT